MFRSIRNVRFVIILAAALVSFLFLPNLDVSVAGPYGHGDDSPQILGGNSNSGGGGGQEGGDPDEFGIYSKPFDPEGDPVGEPVVDPVVDPDDGPVVKELSDFWLVVLRALWAIR